MFRTTQAMTGRYLDASMRLVSSGRLLALLLIPYVLGLVSFFIFLVLGFLNFRMVQGGLTGSLAGLSGASEVITYLAIPVLAIFGGVMVLIAAFQFVLERVLGIVLAERGLQISGERNAWRSFWRIMAEMAIRMVIVGCLLALVILTLLIPFLNIIPAILGAMYLGCDLLGMCFSALRVPVVRQFAILRRHFFQACLVGGFTTGIVLLPIVGIFLFPVSFIVVAELIAEWVQAGDPDLIEKVQPASS
jgi:hypothetical protein